MLEQTLISKRRYELYVDGRCVRSEVHAHSPRWYGHYEFPIMLERARFEDLTTYSDYTDGPATRESRAIIYGAPRPRVSRGGVLQLAVL